MLNALRRAADHWIASALYARRITLAQADDAFDRVAHWHTRLRRMLARVGLAD